MPICTTARSSGRSASRRSASSATWRVTIEKIRRPFRKAGSAGEGETARLRGIGDYIAGMTDRFAIARHEELIGPVNLPEKF